MSKHLFLFFLLGCAPAEKILVGHCIEGYHSFYKKGKERFLTYEITGKDIFHYYIKRQTPPFYTSKMRKQILIDLLNNYDKKSEAYFKIVACE